MNARTVLCPACRQPTEYSEHNRWRPFCSERCRGVDLGAWASESFRVPAEPSPDPDVGPLPSLSRPGELH